MTRLIYWSLAIVLNALCCIALVGCSQPAKDTTTQAAGPDAKREDLSIRIISSTLKRTIHIPAELTAFRDVAVYPKVQGFVKSMSVDRGSQVKKGQVLVELIAPELDANYSEAQAKYETAKSSLLETSSKIETLIAQREEAEAQLQADEANYKRIQHASKTAGAIAPVDLEAAEKTLQGAAAHVRAAEQKIVGAKSELETHKGLVRSAEQALISVREMRAYLTIRAPFDGVIRERTVHEGSLVSSSPSNPPMLRIQETSKLRLLVPVPEAAVASIKQGSAMTFTVPAFVGKLFSGTVSRISHGLERKTRTMIVELDVDNSSKELEPGMYAEVVWGMERPYRTLFVPSSAVLSSNDKTYVIRINHSKTELIAVTRGQPMGNLVEIVGDLKEGDEVLLEANDDIPAGATIRSHVVPLSEMSHEKHDE